MTIQTHKKQLRVLHLEDDKNDAERVDISLRSAGYDCQITLVESQAAFREVLDRDQFDLIISDYTLPSFDGLSALRFVREKDPELPFIFVSGTLGEDSAIESLVNGATDYVLKGKMSRLLPAVERALREAQERRDRLLAEEQTHKAVELYRLITENAGDLIAVLDLDGKRVYNSPSYRTLLGDVGASRGTDSFNEVHPDDGERIKEIFRQTVRSGVGQRSEYRFVLKDGSFRHIESQGNIVSDDTGKPINVVVVSRDITERKHVEEQVAMLAQAVKSVSECVSITDLNDTVLFVNQAFLKTYGYDEHELLGKNIEIVRSPNNSPEVVSDIREMALRGGWHGELLNRRKDGSEFYISLSTSVLRDDDAQSVALIGVATDITDRKRAEEALRAERNLLRTLIDNLPDAIYVKDSLCRKTIANLADVHNAGFQSEAEVLGKDDFDLFPKDQANGFFADDQSVLKTGELILNKEEYFIDKLEQKRWLSTSKVPLRNEKEEIIGLVGIGRDITDRKLAEDRLSFLSQAVQQSPASIVLTDKDGAIEYVNPRFTAMTGYTLKEVLGQNPRILKSGEMPPEEYRRLWQTISGGGEWRGEFHNRRKDGTLYWEYAAISPVVTSGVITHFLAVKEDITERKSMEEHVRQMQKMESIGTLAGGIAHDFNNILAIIMAHLSLIEIKKREPEVVGNSTDAMNKAVQRGVGLVRQILTFARKSDIALEPVSVNQSIRELATMLEETFPKTIEVTLSLENTIPAIAMDRTQLHQALLNLCVNARDAMMEQGGGGRSPGGTLRIETTLVDSIGLRKDHPEAHAAAYVCVSVADTGVGMDEATKQRIFEPFFTTKEVGKGTGLGLAVTYGVVRSHQGLIEVDSAPGKGTTIRLYLPVPEEILAPTTENKSADIDVRGGNEMILLVEDEVGIAELMETLLADRGYRVLRAADGEEAIAVYIAHRDEIAVVLSDLGLPKLDGVALFASLKEINADVKVIIASGYVEPNVRADLTWAGAKAIISKPYEPGEVLRIVRNVLDNIEEKKGS